MSINSRIELNHEISIRAAILGLPPGLVVAGSSAAYLLGKRLVTADTLDEIAMRYDGMRGNRKARAAFDLADGGAQSRPESLLRVRFVISGLPRPVLQHPILLSNGALYSRGWRP